MGIKIASVQGDFNKTVEALHIAPVQGGITKEVKNGYVAPVQGSITKQFYQKESWALQSGTILQCVWGPQALYGSVARTAVITDTIKPTAISISCEAIPVQEQILDVYFEVEYSYDNVTYISLGKQYTDYDPVVGYPYTRTKNWTMDGNTLVKYLRYKIGVRFYNGYDGIQISPDGAEGKCTEWWGQT